MMRNKGYQNQNLNPKENVEGYIKDSVMLVRSNGLSTVMPV